MAFELGEPVRAGEPRPTGHTRLPAYLASKRGIVVRTIGAFALPDDRADGVREPRVENLYTVRFSAPEVWNGDAAGTDSICADLFESYLESDR